MDFSTVSPGHGVVGGKSDVAEHRQYLEDLRDAVAQGIASGDNVEEMQTTIRLDKYKDWFMYDEWRAENVSGMYSCCRIGNSNGVSMPRAGNYLSGGISICFRYNSGRDGSCSDGIFAAIFGLPVPAGT